MKNFNTMVNWGGGGGRNPQAVYSACKVSSSLNLCNLSNMLKSVEVFCKGVGNQKKPLHFPSKKFLIPKVKTVSYQWS